MAFSSPSSPKIKEIGTLGWWTQRRWSWDDGKETEHNHLRVGYVFGYDIHKSKYKVRSLHWFGFGPEDWVFLNEFHDGSNPEEPSPLLLRLAFKV